jgi:hypothetical protein
MYPTNLYNYELLIDNKKNLKYFSQDRKLTSTYITGTGKYEEIKGLISQ